MALDVSPAHPLDPESLALIAGSEAELSSLYPPEVRHAFSPDQLVTARVHCVVARLDGRPAGCGGLAPLAGYGELKRMFTAPWARRRGVAQAVIAALEAEALRRGLPVVRLETGRDSLEAIGLYERMGYAWRGPFGDYAENGSSVFMEKRLGAERAA